MPWKREPLSRCAPDERQTRLLSLHCTAPRGRPLATEALTASPWQPTLPPTHASASAGVCPTATHGRAHPHQPLLAPLADCSATAVAPRSLGLPLPTGFWLLCWGPLCCRSPSDWQCAMCREGEAGSPTPAAGRVSAALRCPRVHHWRLSCPPCPYALHTKACDGISAPSTDWTDFTHV